MPGNEKFRKYGYQPFNIFLVHGGPGAIGDMQPVAEKLISHAGIVETYHKGLSIKEQLSELFEAIVENTSEKTVLIGHSWGAWLICLFASKYPEKVHKLILLCSAPFEAKYAENIWEKRFLNLSDTEKLDFFDITSQFSVSGQIPPLAQERFRFLLMKADSYKLTDEHINYKCKLRLDVLNKVWPEAENMRKNGFLIENIKTIACPVLSIHGDSDPHPAEGVRIPLMKVLNNFRIEILPQCGHYPWFENYSRDRFYKILDDEIK